MQNICAGDRTVISNFLAGNRREQYLEDILAGMRAEPKHISSKFFYDETGSLLFEKITSLPEYYPYSTEKKILERIAPRICSSLGGVDIVEIGAGDCSKISILLSAIPPERRADIRYVPVDISCAALEGSADIISSRFPAVEFAGVVADFLVQMDCIPEGSGRFFCFFGSTIGNLAPEKARQYLAGLKELMSSGDYLLLGVDMVKDRGVLELAYNDPSGVTAEFNRNILNVVNSLAGTDFNPGLFAHIAFFNEERSRIEMHLEAAERMEISSPYLEGRILIDNGERIHTENSHKFTRDQIESMIERAGLSIKEYFTDEKKWFSLILIAGE